MKRLLVVFVAAFGLLLAACSDSPTPATQTFPTHAAIAGIPDCPKSSPSVPAVVDGLPNITLGCLGAGPAVRLAGLRGKPMLVNFWGSWCAPCRAEIPVLAEVQTRAKGSVLILGIDLLDRTSAATAAAEDFGMNYASVEDPEGETQSLLKAVGPPVTLFVDAQGHIVYRHIGAIKDVNQARVLLKEHLGVTLR